MAKKKQAQANIIALNRVASYQYHFIENFEAGLMLTGWEVKSIRQGRVQLKDSYVVMRQGEAFLVNAHISPLVCASTHVETDPMRSRKCLLHRKELVTLYTAVKRQGLTLVPRSMYWKSGKIKLHLAIAKGKKIHDKRAAQRDKDFAKQRAKGFSID